MQLDTSKDSHETEVCSVQKLYIRQHEKKIKIIYGIKQFHVALSNIKTHAMI